MRRHIGPETSRLTAALFLLGIFPSCICSFKAKGRHTDSARRFVFNDEDTIMQTIEECPEMEDKISLLCSTIGSCKDSCGQIVNDVCKCDILCMLYDDCCWDFGDHCPELVDRFKYSMEYLHMGNSACIDGYTVMDSCPLVIDDSLFFSNPQSDHIRGDVIVTDKTTSIQYKNIYVYRCRHPMTYDSKHLMKWSKVYTSVKYKDLTQLKMVLESKVYSDFRNHPPLNVKARSCNRHTKIWCDACVTQPLIVKEITDLCNILSESKSSTHSNTTTSIIAATVNATQDITTPTVEPANSTTMTARSKRCRVKYYTFDKRVGITIFSATLKLTDHTSFLQIEANELQPIPWLSITCMRERPQNPCSYRILCTPGFVFLDEQCLVPTSLEIQMSGDLQAYKYFMELIFKIKEVLNNDKFGMKNGAVHEEKRFPDIIFEMTADISLKNITHTIDFLAYSTAILPILHKSPIEMYRYSHSLYACVSFEQNTFTSHSSKLIDDFEVMEAFPRCDDLTQELALDQRKANQQVPRLVSNSNSQHRLVIMSQTQEYYHISLSMLPGIAWIFL